MTIFDHFDPKLDHHKLHSEIADKFTRFRSRQIPGLRAPQEMQRSAAEARNKNRSAICFDYEPEPRAPAPEAPKAKASKASKEAKAKVPKVPKVKAEEVKPGDLDGKDLGGLMVSISFQSDSL